MSSRFLSLVSMLLVLAFGHASAPRVSFAEDEPAASARAKLVEAAAKGDAKAFAAAIDASQSLVGPAATFPDLGAWADWLDTLPPRVARMRPILVRRGWALVTAKRGEDAIAPLDEALAESPKDGIVRSYLGEALRQAGRLDEALTALTQAAAEGATPEHVAPSLLKLVYDAKREGKESESDALPAYATYGLRALAVIDSADLRVALVQWLTFEGGRAGASTKGGLRARNEALRLAWPSIAGSSAPVEGVSFTRLAYDCAGLAKALGSARETETPERFDFLAQCVRRMAATGADVPELPEAYAELADEALAKGRWLLASRMARRRLEISDSPTARRVLRSLPPDVGE